MRRKPIPNPISSQGARHAARPLAPTRAVPAGFLPTVAALAFALAGCSAPGDESGTGIAADPTSQVSTPIASPSTSTSAGAVDPTPIHMPGEPALVSPTPPPPVKPKVRPYVGTPVPSSKPPKLGGKPVATHPWST